MNVLLDIRIIASLLVGLGLLQLVPVLVALVYGEPALPYLLSAAPALAFGLPLVLTAEPGEDGPVRDALQSVPRP